jgi:hypothetical protein
MASGERAVHRRRQPGRPAEHRGVDQEILAAVAAQAVADQHSECGSERGGDRGQKHCGGNMGYRGERKRSMVSVAAPAHHELLAGDGYCDERRHLPEA